MTQQQLATKPQRNWANFIQRIYPYISILPVAVVIALFAIYPIIHAVRMSFYQYILTRPNAHPFVGLQNFANVITSYYFKQSIQVTGIYTVAAVSGVIIYGLGVALLMNTKIRLSTPLKIVILLPWALPAVVSGLLWKWILNADFGILNGILYSVGLIDSYIPFLADPTLAKASLVMAFIWKEGPLVAIFFLAGLQLISEELYEAAALDGAKSWRRLFHITLPLISPALFFNLIINIIGSFQVFTQALIMTASSGQGSEGGPNNSTLFFVLYLYKKAFQQFKMGYASSLAWVLFIIILVFTLTQFVLSRRWVYYETDERMR